MEKKQNSVEYLMEMIKLNSKDFYAMLFEDKVFEQAKAMHKEEVKTSMSVAFLDGLRSGDENYKAPYEDWEKYYNETFGGQDNE